MSQIPRRRKATWIALGFVGASLLGLAASRVLAMSAFLVPSASMAPNIAPGDRVVVETSAGRLPARGEIWAFRMPAASGSPAGVAVKRVIGLPGETIEVCGGVVHADGRPLQESYLCRDATYAMGPITLGEGEYFVLGDNRDASLDSHRWGALPADHLIGRVRYRYWPPRRMRGL